MLKNLFSAAIIDKLRRWQSHTPSRSRRALAAILAANFSPLLDVSNLIRLRRGSKFSRKMVKFRYENLFFSMSLAFFHQLRRQYKSL